ncbi:hypothetical protein [Williamsoniiplasma luminosum]|nr:hypothetical protein [Williamsoniiplasma luminosum]
MCIVFNRERNNSTTLETKMMVDENSNVVRHENSNNPLNDEPLEILMERLSELKKAGEITSEIRQKNVELNKIILRKRVNINNN